MPEKIPVGETRTHRPRVRRRWLLAWGLAIISGSLLISVTLHSHQSDWHLRWIPEDAPPSGEAAISVVRPAGWELQAAEGTRIRLRVSEADREVLTGSGGDYEGICRGTEVYLATLGCRVERTFAIGGAAPPDARSILCLPYAYCLSTAQWDSLARFCEEGGSLFVLGPLAVRDEDGNWQGWSRMLEFLGGEEAWELPQTAANFVTLGRVAPIASADLQGARIAIDRGPSALGIRCDQPLAWWSGYHRRAIGPGFQPTGPEADHSDGLPDGEAEPWAAALAGTRMKGSWLWAGFPLEWVHDSPQDMETSRSWLGAATAWLDGRPAVSLELWPGGAEAAVLLEEDSESEFAHVEAFRAMLDQKDLRGSFFCVSDLAREHADLLRRIAGHHEIGSHTDNHQAVRGRSARFQRARLRLSGQTLSRLSGQPVRGFRPPEEKFDATTLRAMAGEGYRYLLGDSDEALATPAILRTGSLTDRGSLESATTIVQIPRLVRDDYDLVVSHPIPQDRISEELGADLRKVRRFGGLDFFSLHTHLLGRPESIGAIGPFLDEIRTLPVWVTTPGELASWWLARDSCEVSLRRGDGAIAGTYAMTGGAEGPAGEERMWELRVRNRSGRAVDGWVVAVALGRGSLGPDPTGCWETVTTAAIAGGAPGSPESVPFALRPDHLGVVRVPIGTVPALGDLVTVLRSGGTAALAGGRSSP